MITNYLSLTIRHPRALHLGELPIPYGPGSRLLIWTFPFDTADHEDFQRARKLASEKRDEVQRAVFAETGERPQLAVWKVVPGVKLPVIGEWPTDLKTERAHEAALLGAG